MKRYQIRTPKGFIIEDVIEEMSGKGWDAIKRSLDFSDSHAPLKDYRRFQNHLYRAFLPFVQAFRLCGIDEVCIDLVESAPLSEDPERFEVSPWDFIYHLFIPEDLPKFVELITHETLDGIEYLLKPGKEGETCVALRKIFEEILGDYLYWNPVCGKAKICLRSKAVRIPCSENGFLAAHISA